MERTFFLKTYGCSANQADGQKMSTLLRAANWKPTSRKKASVIILNTCGVKNTTEKKILKRLKRLSKLGNKPVVIAGCLPRIALKKIIEAIPDFAAILDTRSIHQISEIMQQVVQGKTHLKYLNSPDMSLKKSKIYNIDDESIIGIINISEGCLGSCTYCVTRYARGRLHSFPINDIINHARFLISSGKKELWITSQDNGSYNYKGNTLVDLLQRLLEIPKDFRIRIGMTNPDTLKPIIDDLLYLIKNDPRIYNFLHIPVQAGNDRVLQKMDRNYSIREFKELVKKIKATIPKISLSTDIICGFGLEDEEEFGDTLNLLRWMKPTVVNISRFSLRTNSMARKMQHVHGRISKERSTKATKLVEKIRLEQKQKWLGKEIEILVNEFGKDNTKIGRTQTYEPVVVQNGKLGTFMKVKIVEANPYYLTGESINKP